MKFKDFMDCHFNIKATAAAPAAAAAIADEWNVKDRPYQALS